MRYLPTCDRQAHTPQLGASHTRYEPSSAKQQRRLFCSAACPARRERKGKQQKERRGGAAAPRPRSGGAAGEMMADARTARRLSRAAIDAAPPSRWGELSAESCNVQGARVQRAKRKTALSMGRSPPPCTDEPHRARRTAHTATTHRPRRMRGRESADVPVVRSASQCWRFILV